MHGGAKGSGAPRGNQNALTHGTYTKEAFRQRAEIPPSPARDLPGGPETAPNKRRARKLKRIDLSFSCLYFPSLVARPGLPTIGANENDPFTLER